jgi:hypothetical protein
MSRYYIQVSYRGKPSNRISRSLLILLGSATYSDFDDSTGWNILEYHTESKLEESTLILPIKTIFNQNGKKAIVEISRETL